MLDLIERKGAPDLELDNPVMAIRALSHDPELKTVVKRKNGQTISGCELQRAYFQSAQQLFAGSDEETDWVLSEWDTVLSRLEEDRFSLVGQVDWVTKLWLLETFVQEEKLEWNDPWLASLDLEYHNINPARGLFLGLEMEGRAKRIVSEAEIVSAMQNGPQDTRGGIRGSCIRRFGSAIKAVQWESIQFKNGPASHQSGSQRYV